MDGGRDLNNVGARNDRTCVAIVDALPIFRAGVAQALLTQPRFEIAAEGSSAMDALRIAGERPIDIMLIDVNIPGGGMQALTTLTRTWPAIKLVVLTASEREDDVTNALQQGARGYILKHIDENGLLGALSAVANGEVYLTPSLGANLLARLAAVNGAAKPTPALVELTYRESQILTEVSVGATNKEIARRLHISEKTVKYYMTNIMQKLQVRNRVEAVVVLRERMRLSA